MVQDTYLLSNIIIDVCTIVGRVDSALAARLAGAPAAFRGASDADGPLGAEPIDALLCLLSPT